MIPLSKRFDASNSDIRYSKKFRVEAFSQYGMHNNVIEAKDEIDARRKFFSAMKRYYGNPGFEADIFDIIPVDDTENSKRARETKISGVRGQADRSVGSPKEVSGSPGKGDERLADGGSMLPPGGVPEDFEDSYGSNFDEAMHNAIVEGRDDPHLA